MATTSKLLLKSKLEKLSKQNRKGFLFNCIEKSKSDLIDKLLIEEKPDKVTSEDHSFCKICNSYDFIKESYQVTCKQCGYTRNILSKGQKFEVFEYIKPGSNLVKIMKDGRKITVDLNKINSWLENVDPLARDTKRIIENLEIVYTSKGIELTTLIKNTVIALWYNFNNLYENTKFESSKLLSYNKRGIMALCIYYGSSINNVIITLEQLSILFDVNVSVIREMNEIFKVVFKNTEYEKYLVLINKKMCEIKLSPRNNLIMIKINEHLKKEYKLDRELNNKEYTAIVYFITNKINPTLKYTYEDISKKCNVSTTTIRNEVQKLELFYKNNKKLLAELKI